MKTFKITNITNLLNKRNFKENSELEADYVDGMITKILKIKPKETVYLTLQSLPLSIHKLRIKGFVTVTDVSNREINSLINANKKKEVELDEIEDSIKKRTKKSTKIEEHSIENLMEKKSTKKVTKKNDNAETED